MVITESNCVPEDRANGLTRYCSDQEENLFVYSEYMNVNILIQIKNTSTLSSYCLKHNLMECVNFNGGIAKSNCCLW